jgi:hypothetical protein
VPQSVLAQKRASPLSSSTRRRLKIQRSTRSRSGYRGVFPAGKNGWCSKISINGQIHCLGSFPTRELAAAAFSEAAEHRAAANLQRKLEASKRVIDRIRRGNFVPKDVTNAPTK